MAREHGNPGLLTSVSLFSGGGGLDLGLEAAGFTTLFATDIDEHSCKTLEMGKAESQRRGLPFLRDSKILQADINDVDPKYILEAVQRKAGEISILMGGPPCQAFSVFGKRQGLKDPRGLLPYQYFRILKHLKPQAFIFENVYGLLTIDGGRIYKEVIERLSSPGGKLAYEVSIFRLNASDFAVPQYRDRIFIIGHRKGNRVDFIHPITPETPGIFDGNIVPRNVRDAFRGLPPIGSSYPANHVGRVHSQAIIERYGQMRPGERDSHTRINKLDLNKPSFTIVVGSDKGGGKGHIHPVEPREVTPRESARIQTFPDWWAFSGTSRHPIRQIGNAVPPVLAACIGNEIRSQLFGLEKIPLAEILRSLGQEHLFEGEQDSNAEIPEHIMAYR